MTGMSRLRRGIAAGLAALLLALGGWVAWLHARTWDWGITPAAAPPKLELFSRDYQRESPGGLALPADARPLGRTLGGGQILGQRPAPYVPTAVWVRTSDGVHVYVLLGGP
jgi:hypothetical protein